MTIQNNLKMITSKIKIRESAAKVWQALTDKTTLTAEVDLSPEHAVSFDDVFPKGLAKIKELAELY